MHPHPHIPKKTASSKVAVGISIVFGKMCSILGYSLIALGALIMLVFTIDGDYAELHLMFITFMPLGTLLIVLGARTKRRIRRFRTYVNIISNGEDDLAIIAHHTNKTVQFITKDIQKMINKRYFYNAVLDFANNKVIMIARSAPINNMLSNEEHTHQQDPYSAFETCTCPGCGAMRTKERGVIVSCEYCGSSI